MNKIWIGNGQLVLPDKIVPGGSVLLEGKKIAAVNVPCPPDARRVDVDGSYIMAGFVDIHVHGGGDSDFMDEDASAFPTIAKAHCAHGTTALCPTTMTCADSLLEKTIDLFLEADKEPENGAELLERRKLAERNPGYGQPFWICRRPDSDCRGKCLSADSLRGDSDVRRFSDDMHPSASGGRCAVIHGRIASRSAGSLWSGNACQSGES